MTLEGSLLFSELVWASCSGYVPLISYSRALLGLHFLAKQKKVQWVLVLSRHWVVPPGVGSFTLQSLPSLSAYLHYRVRVCGVELEVCSWLSVIPPDPVLSDECVFKLRKLRLEVNFEPSPPCLL